MRSYAKYNRPILTKLEIDMSKRLILFILSLILISSLVFGCSISPATVTKTVTTTTETPTREYTNFHNSIGGFDIEYPSSWQANLLPDGQVSFSNDLDNTTIEVQYLSANYQIEFNIISSQATLESKIARQGNLAYSTFWTTDSPAKRLYVCDINNGTLVLKCTNANSLDIMSYVGHMLDSFHLINANISIVTPLISPTRVTIITPSVIQKLTPTAIAPTTSVPVKQIIDPQTGVYKNYFLGLVNDGGNLGGDGCYDDKGKFIVLINNKNAENPTYARLINFLQTDKTDQFPYKYTGLSMGSYFGTAESRVDLNRIQSIIDGAVQPNPPNVCGDFAERLHNDAEMAGIRCAYVSVDLSGYTDPYNYGIPSDSGHALVAFQTTDKGLIYIDDTNAPGPARCVKTVDVKVGQQYIPTSIFPESGWNSIWDSMGSVTNIFMTWDGSWNN
jgi:hypothetical protein